ncbi:MAG: hypothetical protein HY833_02985 [Candidatus Aenigmarchaeota archaeon]|nr:hypothetical protein [Candidatus Aenigmarchaeota archaeon]
MKTKLAVAIVLILVLSGLIAGYNYFIGPIVPVQTGVPSQTEAPSQTGGESVEAGVNYLETAKAIYSYIETQRKSDGFYVYSSNCNDESCSFFNQSYETGNTWPAYAAVSLYGATGDGAYLDRARRDADLMIEHCGKDPTECITVAYQINDLYAATGDKKYLDFIVSEADALEAISDEDYLRVTDSSMLFAVDSLQLADAYKLTGEQRYLDSSLRKLQTIDEVFSVEDRKITVYERDGRKFNVYSCWPELARMHLYGATGDAKYLSQAKEFADGMRVQDNVHQLWFMTDIQPCIDVYQQLGAATGDPMYGEGADSMVRHVIAKYWDSSASPKVSGNNAIKSSVDKDHSLITDSSYMVYLLSNVRSGVSV